MANSYANPWVLDTASTSATLGGGGWVGIGGITLRGYSTSGHKALFKDAAGKTVAELVGTSDLAPVSIGYTKGLVVNGLVLHTLDSGSVVVEVQ